MTPGRPLDVVRGGYGPRSQVRNHVVGRPESLDHLEPARLFHEHSLALVVRMAHFHHEATRHPPDELTLRQRDRDKLDAGRIRAFAEKIDPASLFDTADSPFVDLSAQGFGQRGLTLAFPMYISCHNSSLPRAVRESHPANRRYTVQTGRTAEHAEVVGPTAKATPR
jgi:hypothetical protein